MAKVSKSQVIKTYKVCSLKLWNGVLILLDNSLAIARSLKNKNGLDRVLLEKGNVRSITSLRNKWFLCMCLQRQIVCDR